MACWKVGTEDLRASLLLLESVDEECCGIVEVLIEDTVVVRVKWRREKRWLRLAVRRREKREVWGLRKEMTKGKARMAMAIAMASSLSFEARRVRLSHSFLGFMGGTFCNLRYRSGIII